MAAKLKSLEARKLVKEFEGKLNLKPVEAHRSAFVVFALSKGWRHARIGRYLGVTRHRIGQRAERYLQYAASGDFPQLGALLNGNSPPVCHDADLRVHFTPGDWDDLDLACELINRVA